MSLFPTRRKFLKLGAAGIAAGALGIAGDGTFFEANRPKLVSLEVHLNRLPESPGTVSGSRNSATSTTTNISQLYLCGKRLTS